MRIGILGDVHSNIEALNAVVEKLRGEDIDHWIQVGDIVGYGPDPQACLDLIQELRCRVCMGNHDAAVVGTLPTDYFNAYAREAIEWTRSKLRRADFEYLRGLPLTVVHHEYTVAHGTLFRPEQFGYVLTPVEAQQSMQEQRTKIAFVGHSHVPAVYVQKPDDSELTVSYEPELSMPIDPDAKTLVNVGSVGQPRDEDPRAAYAIYDTAASHLEIRRVEYDIGAVQLKIRAAGLPGVLADRLALGV